MWQRPIQSDNIKHVWYFRLDWTGSENPRYRSSRACLRSALDRLAKADSAAMMRCRKLLTHDRSLFSLCRDEGAEGHVSAGNGEPTQETRSQQMKKYDNFLRSLMYLLFHTRALATPICIHTSHIFIFIDLSRQLKCTSIRSYVSGLSNWSCRAILQWTSVQPELLFMLFYVNIVYVYVSLL